jgi:hypothetical protein
MQYYIAHYNVIERTCPFVPLVAVSLRKAKCIHKSVMFGCVGALSLGGSANIGRIEKMSHCYCLTICCNLSIKGNVKRLCHLPLLH